MLKPSKLATYFLLMGLPFAFGCSVIGGGASNDPMVQSLEEQVKAQEAVADQAKQQSRAADDELDARRSRLKAAKHQAKANRAVN